MSHSTKKEEVKRLKQRVHNEYDRLESLVNQITIQAIRGDQKLRQLTALNQIAKAIKKGHDISNVIEEIITILPRAFSFPDFLMTNIQFKKVIYGSREMQVSDILESLAIETLEGDSVEVNAGYPAHMNLKFSQRESDFLNYTAELVTRFLNFEYLDKSSEQVKSPSHKTIDYGAINIKELRMEDEMDSRDIYHDLMPFRVREILFVSTVYDAHFIEEEGDFLNNVLGEYHRLNLTRLPRINYVTSLKKAMEELTNKHIDLVIVMMGANKILPFDICQKIRDRFPFTNIYLLLNNKGDIHLLEKRKTLPVDQYFVWNGDSRVFFAMVKALEDKINLFNDTNIGHVRVILLLEHSPGYYSRYLPLLHGIIMEQTKRIIDDVSTDERYKVLKMRARPKLILARNYEEAVDVFNSYKQYILCLITDVRFDINGKMEEEAGLKLVKYFRETNPGLPVLIQSSEEGNRMKAMKLKSRFVNKNSDSLAQEFRDFIQSDLGFGDFIFRDPKGNQVGIARNMKEFEKILDKIPDDSIMYHGRNNHFSLWLMARGEVQIARIINPKSTTDFDHPDELRAYLGDMINQYRSERRKGRIVGFTEDNLADTSTIVALSSGSFGGKGRGCAFIYALLNKLDFNTVLPGIEVKSPVTFLIGTDEFDKFLADNGWTSHELAQMDFEEAKQLILKGRLSDNLFERMRIILEMYSEPIAIRSSSLFEDSLLQPFAGVFETYLVPNNHPDINVRLADVSRSIKSVYASIFSPMARAYYRAVNYQIEEEKMSIVIQKVVGNQYENLFYPHISGTAQSYNYYPFAHMKPEEGFAVAALGLGKYVVEGEKAYRFSPKYPGIENASPEDQYKSSQVEFYAVNMSKKELNFTEGEETGLIRVSISRADKHGTLRFIASTYDMDTGRIFPGTSKPGPRIINFASILKHEYFPMAPAIQILLKIFSDAMGSAVEIEYAIDLEPNENGNPTFYLLQIKPLIGRVQDYDLDLDEISEENLLVLSAQSLGNGLIDDITDLIYIDPDFFEKKATEQIAKEVAELNEILVGQERKYILIGPGRWGTRDPYMGIPVTWSQIANASVIIETDMQGFPLETSSGSHFFHNVTSMNVGYLTVYQGRDRNTIDWDLLKDQKLIQSTKYLKHIRFKNPLWVRLDGKQRIAAIHMQ